MDEAKIRLNLFEKTEKANSHQLKELYGIVTNYFNAQETVEEFDSLPEYQKEKIPKSIAQADAGLGKPAKEVIRIAYEKHGFNH